MSMVKRAMERAEDQQRVATQIALDAKVLARCPYHDEIFDPLAGDNSPAYRLGNIRLSAGELGDVFSNPREMTDAILAAVENAGMECPGCAKNRDS